VITLISGRRCQGRPTIKASNWLCVSDTSTTCPDFEAAANANGNTNPTPGLDLGEFDIITAVAALEMALAKFGARVDLGAGVAAAQRVLVEGLPAA